MQSHSSPNKIQFTAGTTNVNVGDKADVVILLGPDNPNDTILQKQFIEIQEYCESKHLKYVILGDGKNPVHKDDIATLPKANYVIINGHGKIGKDSNDATAHLISIIGNADCLLDLMHEVQMQTDSSRFLCCACFAGRLNEDIKLKGKINTGTEIVTTSPPDEVSSIKYNFSAIKNLLMNIANSHHKKAPVSGYFGNLLKACPETMTYGKQLKNGFQTFTVRRQDRAILGEGDPQKYFEYNRKRLNEFLRANHLPVYKLEKMTDEEALNYRKTTFLHHVWHCDAEAVEKLISIDPEIMTELPQSPLNFALKIHSIHATMSKNRDQVKRLLSVLIPHDPQGLTNYMQSVNTHNPNNAASFHSIKTLLYEIATETHSPHVIRELCTTVQTELVSSIANLADAQIQLHQIQLLQDPAFMQQRHMQATVLLQNAVWLAQQAFWIVSQMQFLTPAQIQTAYHQLNITRTAMRIAQQQLDQSQLDVCLQHLQRGIDLTQHGLQQCQKAALEDHSQMSQLQYYEHLQMLYQRAQSLLNQTNLELSHADNFFVTQMQISHGQLIIPNHAHLLQQEAQLQAVIAKELFEHIKSKLQINEQELNSHASADLPQPTKEDLAAEAARLSRLVEIELKHLPVVIANINKYSTKNEVENAAFSKTSAEKRIKDVMTYLIKLKLLGSPSVDKYTARLNALAGKLQESVVQKENLAHRQGLNK